MDLKNQRLKNEGNDRLKLEWNLQRTLAKVNYQIYTDAIKENLITQSKRLIQLNKVAITQMKSLLESSTIKSNELLTKCINYKGEGGL